jgi:hypothetical protein
MSSLLAKFHRLKFQTTNVTGDESQKPKKKIVTLEIRPYVNNFLQPREKIFLSDFLKLSNFPATPKARQMP